MQDLQGGCFTISNGGTYGSLLSTPILNPPQSGILGMHAIQERPVVRDGQIIARPMMYLALSYDHRLVDGKQAVQFLITVKMPWKTRCSSCEEPWEKTKEERLNVFPALEYFPGNQSFRRVAPEKQWRIKLPLPGGRLRAKPWSFLSFYRFP